MKKWEQFSKEQLIKILQESKTYTEALKKLGYSGSSNYNKHIRDIAQLYNIDISHYPTGKVKDLIGQKFGKLTVIERVPNKNGGVARWKCQCECGKFTEVDGSKLRQGDTLSCGCLVKDKILETNKNKLIDLTNKRFGKLLVLSRANNIGEQPAWNCLCDCGTMVTVLGGNLRKPNGTRSCGCISSKGEEKIASLLTQYNINFLKEVTFKDCLSKRGFLLRFDFGIYNKNNELLYLIEFNGRQHYSNTCFYGENFDERIERDQIKKEYCQKNNIPLIIIPYTSLFDFSINDLLLETTSFLYKVTNDIE